MARIGLVHGGAAGVFDESNVALRMLAAAGAKVTYIAVNDCGMVFPGRLHHWGSLHADKFPMWIAKRRQNGLPMDFTVWSLSTRPECVERSVQKMRGGSSGLHGVDIALHGLGLDGAIACGIPIDERLNEFSRTTWAPYQRFKAGWEKPDTVAVLEPRFRSMSGWTRQRFGEPTLEWIMQLANR